jgi:hypothetical protein
MSSRALVLSLTLVLSASGMAYSADVPLLAAPQTVVPADSAQPALLYNPAAFEVRGGYSIGSKGPEIETSNVTGAVVFPKFVSLPGWQDLLIPRLRIGGVANLGGRTSYAYLNGLWTVNFDRVFAELFFGGMVHDGRLLAPHADMGATALGCRELYHFGGNLGYRLDQHWSVMATFEHSSNGTPVWSDCPQNRGLNVSGVSMGYAF